MFSKHTEGHRCFCLEQLSSGHVHAGLPLDWMRVLSIVVESLVQQLLSTVGVSSRLEGSKENASHAAQFVNNDPALQAWTVDLCNGNPDPTRGHQVFPSA